MIGARITRVRTFAKYIDAENFYTSSTDDSGVVSRYSIGDDVLIPEGFEPDPLAEFPREIFFINRKSAESKSGIEFELGSFADFENLQLPSRIVLSRYCQFQYRGEGCLYEYRDVAGDLLADGGKTALEEGFGSDSINELNLPCKAPPIADEDDELFEDAMEGAYDPTVAPVKYDPKNGGPPGHGDNYGEGDVVYLTKNSQRYYFIGKVDDIPAGKDYLAAIPPNTNYWFEDKCSKTIRGCKLRWSDIHKTKTLALGPNTASLIETQGYTMGDKNSGCRTSVPKGNTHIGCLPFGGFPAVEKLESIKK
jgi:phage-related protein